jgi:hypothetical protein
MNSLIHPSSEELPIACLAPFSIYGKQKEKAKEIK